MLNLDTLSLAPEPSPDELTFDPKWSHFQTSIFRFVAGDSRSANIVAAAGSGKTTVILESMKYLRGHGNASFLAFNRSIADELRARVPAGIEAATFHSIGNRALRNHKKLVLNKYRVSNFLDDHYKDRYKKLFGAARQLIDLSRNIGLGLEGMPDFSMENLAELADNADIAPRKPDDFEAMVSVARSSLLMLTSPDSKDYDFTDMLYFPLLWKLPFPKVSTLFVDEAQDLNTIQHMILSESLERNGRVLAVGDPNQAIYGFRGADAYSMQSLQNRFSSVELPLSISYRCPLRVIELAQTLVPSILPWDRAIEGAVRYIFEDQLALPTLSINDMILCRNNAPIIGFALRMLAARLPMRVQGDFGDKLVAFARSFKTDDMHIFRIRLQEWFDGENARLSAQEKWGKLALVEDKYNAMMILANGAKSIDDLLMLLARIFEQGHGPIISTIHKAKGLEAQRVFILRPDLMPSKYAQSAEAIQQENNLKYVVYTRAKEELIFLNPIESEE